MYDSEREGEELVNSFLERCPNVKRLSINDTRTSWVHAFGKQLQKLEFRSGIPVDFAQDCIGLRELTLNSSSGGDISSGFWQKLGTTLKAVVTYGMFLVENEVRYVQEHCRALKSI